MALRKANCLTCGSPLVYWEEAKEVTCVICGKKDMAHCVCEQGHFVCDACHREKGVQFALDVCMESDSVNPIQILTKIMDGRAIYQNGPEHHTLVGAAVIAAYVNAGGDLSKEEALTELKKRGLQLPGGACGYWGVCGAAASCGQALSVILGSTPLTKEPWGHCHQLTSNILGSLAKLGGPRCCKRSSYVGVLESVDYINQITDVTLEKPDSVTCHFFGRNAECLREACPFFPVKTDRTASV